jgi:L-ascorbate metabolism protein UlaG (beta-lactamase superfamily)
MLPEESVQAGLDLKSKKVMPIHWGKFDLSFHSWYEPIERFTKSAQEKKLDYTTPKI